MKLYFLTTACILNFERHLYEEERAAATVEKYLRDVTEFTVFLAGRPVSREEVLAWREWLLSKALAPATVNGKLSAVNSLLSFLGWDGFRVKFLKLQRRIFRPSSRELSRDEYFRLLETARALGRERLALLMETICSTGTRVSELRFVTVEAVQSGQAVIRLKGKVRTILLPRKLRQKLLKYARAQKIASGELFLTRSGKPLTRKQIWREMKALCVQAGVEASKVFPHNLRHLFATSFYRVCRDIVKLADVLGHSSIETTRIYLLTTSAEHSKYLEQLRLVC